MSGKNYQADLVTKQACHAALWYICWVPVSLLFADDWPQYPPRKYSTKQGWKVDKVWADHPRTNVCEAEIEEKPDSQIIQILGDSDTGGESVRSAEAVLQSMNR